MFNAGPDINEKMLTRKFDSTDLPIDNACTNEPVIPKKRH